MITPNSLSKANKSNRNQRMTALIQATRVPKNILGTNPSVVTTERISHLLSDDTFGAINLRPWYQRDIRWTLQGFNDFIGNIINHRTLVQGIMLYRYQDEEDKEKYQGKYDQEVVDGQHRLFALKAFQTSKVQQITPRIKNIKKPFIVSYQCETDADEKGAGQ